MGRCFVIQPFDGGTFDKRYESVYSPAIIAADLEPYRVDRDPAVNIPIQEIETGIRDADVCLADITTDNPNVWFELGFAFAIPREVVLLCSNERTAKYPFDVQHRTIIKYNTSAPQDFDELKIKITKRIQALLKKEREIGRIALSAVKDTDGLTQHELVALVTVMQNSFLSNGYVSGYTIQKDMNKAGSTDIAVAIALKTLTTTKNMLESDLWHDMDGEPYAVYKATPKGEKWLIDNQDKLQMETDVPF